VQLRLIEVPGLWHLNNCKPHFIEDLLFKTYPEADLVYYFDTDMVITHSWNSFAQWAESGSRWQLWGPRRCQIVESRWSRGLRGPDVAQEEFTYPTNAGPAAAELSVPCGGCNTWFQRHHLHDSIIRV
jgi:hypothetical protein